MSGRAMGRRSRDEQPPIEIGATGCGHEVPFGDWVRDNAGAGWQPFRLTHPSPRSGLRGGVAAPSPRFQSGVTSAAPRLSAAPAGGLWFWIDDRRRPAGCGPGLKSGPGQAAPGRNPLRGLSSTGVGHTTGPSSIQSAQRTSPHAVCPAQDFNPVSLPPGHAPIINPGPHPARPPHRTLFRVQVCQP
jgi:hypothetical protein